MNAEEYKALAAQELAKARTPLPRPDPRKSFDGEYGGGYQAPNDQQRLDELIQQLIMQQSPTYKDSDYIPGRDVRQGGSLPPPNAVLDSIMKQPQPAPDQNMQYDQGGYDKDI
jgi:hypothetical protein